MKKVLGIFVVLSLAGVFAACDSGNNNNDQDIIITPDNSGTDVRDNGGKDNATDPGRDNAPVDPGTETTPPVDNGPDYTPPDATDPGPQTDPGPVDPGTVDPGTVDNGTDPGTGACVDEGEKSCAGYWACAGDCPQDTTGDACRQECQSKLSPRGLADYQGFVSCLQKNCASAQTDQEFYDCLEAKCIAEYYGCFWGCQYGNCADLIGCLSSCPADNPATTDVNEQSECIGNCWSGGTTAAQLDLQGAIDCSNTACPVCSVANPTPAQDTECNDCWNTSSSGTCATQWDKCASYGTQKCGQMFQCVFQGTCTDSACVQECLRQGTKTAGGLWDAMTGCMFDNCTVCDVQNPTTEQETQCNDCLNAAINAGGTCETQANACMNDQAAQ